MTKIHFTEGGDGSGNHGHGGRPGQVGGSSSGHSDYTYGDLATDETRSYHKYLVSKYTEALKSGDRSQVEYFGGKLSFTEKFYGIKKKEGTPEFPKLGTKEEPVQPEKKVLRVKMSSKQILTLSDHLNFIFKGPKLDNGSILLPSPFYQSNLRDFARAQGFRYFDSNRGVWSKRGDSKELDRLQGEWNKFWDIGPNENFKGWIKRTRPDFFKDYSEINLPGLSNPEDRWK